MQTETDKLANALAQGAAQYESIKEMVDALRKAREDDDSDAEDEARTRILEDALSVEVRSHWHAPGGESDLAEYRLLLCWGGPAAQIIGELDMHGEPESATLQVQDWFVPWTAYTGEGDYATLRGYLLDYARCFYFGEG